MSAIDFYLNKGYTPLTNVTVISGSNTIAVWTPKSGTRAHITNVGVSVNYAGTLAFYWASSDVKVAEYLFSSSSTISPVIGVWEGTTVANALVARAGGAAGTDGLRVNLTGFDIS